MVLVPDSTVHCSRPPARNLHLSSSGSATCKPCPMVLVPDNTVHCSRPPARNLYLSSSDHAVGPWVGFMYIYTTMLCFSHDVIPAGWCHVHTFIIRTKYVRHTKTKISRTHRRTDGFFFGVYELETRFARISNAWLFVARKLRVLKGTVRVYGYQRKVVVCVMCVYGVWMYGCVVVWCVM